MGSHYKVLNKLLSNGNLDQIKDILEKHTFNNRKENLNIIRKALLEGRIEICKFLIGKLKT